MKDKNLMCMGDFNTPLFPLEKIGGIIDLLESMKDLLDFINTHDLINIDLKGNPFTWSNNRKGEDLI